MKLFSQSYVKFQIGGSLSGIGSVAYLSGSTHLMPSGQTAAHYADSVRPLDSYKLSLGAYVWGGLFLSKNWYLQTGIGYMDIGFTREQRNIQYLDPLYPGIGKGLLLEKSGGSGEKIISYDYHYHYLQIPVMARYEFYHTKDFYYKVSAVAGIGLNVLLNHQMTARLYSFVVDGTDKFTVDSTGYSPRSFTVNAFIGAKGEYKMDKHTTAFVMPVIGLFPMSVTSADFSTWPFYLQIHAGLQYALLMKDDKSK